ncbi:peptidylprolyl isomerase [Flavobacterium sp. NRK F10]|uniref:peptidylprolyl isomerase n=1 Tax=Flavobacterium sp. NRK F10 TaxID=2954931 RepID=UPI002091BC97|nr:peptidylprolyl isomerase [Flavobacterium sp. NRK F10]MCO6174496.1 peptidylprolyl isomerase [Flavobacterium sp. NRK F10]
MAVLGKIRQKTGLLIFLIALALIIFVVQGALENGFFGSNANNIGSVNGTDIDAQTFMRKVAQVEKQNQNMSNTQAMNNVWEQELRGIIVGEQVEKLGLGIADDQLINVIKTNPYFSQNPQFLNAAGQFDEAKFKEFVKSIKNDQNQDRWAEWQNFENEVEKSAIEQLYFNLIKGSIYTTKAEGKFKHVAENKKVDFEYVTVPYNTINNDEVKVSDDEIIAYMKEHPKQYKSDATRAIDYVLFENKASKEDEDLVGKTINEVLYGNVEFNKKTQKNDTIPAFKDVVNVAEFVNKYSDIKFDSTYLAKKELPLDYQEQLFNLGKGEVFGPYLFSNHQCVSRMLDRKPNASAKASHILISFEGAERSTATRTKDEAQALANELLAKVKANPNEFASLAAANSDDPGSKNNGGVYDNIAPGQMVPTFNDFVFNNPVGTTGIVETDFGFHVIKVLDKYDAVLLATVAQSIEPSETTIDAIYTKASKFEALANEKKFDEAAKEVEATIVPASNLKASDEYVAGLGAQREIVRWAFNDDTNNGDVRRFDVPQGYVVAVLKDKNETGLLSIDVARQSVGNILMNKKKAEIIKKKMSGATLEDVSKATGSSMILASGVATSSPFIPNIGSEPKVIGTAFDLEAGKTSKLIDGNTGVFMIRTKSITDAPEAANINSYVETELTQQQNAAQMRAYQALKEKAKIEDERARF